MARALAEALRQTLLAAVYWQAGRLVEFQQHLHAAIHYDHTALSDSPPRDPPWPPAGHAEPVVFPDLERCLVPAENRWGHDCPAVGMVRSALATLFPRQLKVRVIHAVHLPVLLVGRGGGQIKKLTLERLAREGSGHCFFPDPVALGCTALDAKFLRG